MELKSHLSQRLVDLRGHHEHEQTGEQVHATGHQPEPDLDGDDRHRQGRDELQDRPRQEGDPQGRHGGAPVGAPQGPHPLGRLLLTPQGLEGGQSRDEVEHLVAQDLHGLQPLLGDGLSHPADKDHEDRDEGQGAHHSDSGRPVLGDENQHCRRSDRGGQYQLGQVAGEVGFQVIQTSGQQRGGLGPVHRLPPRAQPGGVLQDQTAQLDDRPRRRAMGMDLLQEDHQGPGHHDTSQSQQQPSYRRGAGAAGDDCTDRARDEEGLCHHQRGGRHSGHGRRGDVSPGRTGVTHQPRVERLHPSKDRGVGPKTRCPRPVRSSGACNSSVPEVRLGLGGVTHQRRVKPALIGVDALHADA